MILSSTVHQFNITKHSLLIISPSRVYQYNTTSKSIDSLFDDVSDISGIMPESAMLVLSVFPSTV